MRYDYIVIGGGIVGLSTALQLQQRYPDYKILVLEKEAALAQHQTGHNSGVVHSGIYYRPGSLKARFCRIGAAAIKDYCERHQIPFRQPGKLIVATTEEELSRLHSLFALSKEHGIATRWIAADSVTEMEPNIRGRAAIWVEGVGIVDYGRIANCFATDFQALGGTIKLGTAVQRLEESERAINIVSDQGEFTSRFLVVCGGLQADRLARELGIKIDFRIIPVRGEYYQLPARRPTLVERLIYPVPAPDMPFLGVHITPMTDGRITLGPNAVFAWRREAGGGWRDVRESFAFPGFWRMGAKYWRFALAETYNSLSRRAYLSTVQKYCPQLTLRDLLPHPSGVRAQAVANDGSLIHDFLFAESPRSLHVCNAPSPAATSAIPIGAYLCDKLTKSGRY
ncbi:MAG: L-2-hydroxyglutarate oxidase [Cellvibrionaceae bacterium]